MVTDLKKDLTSMQVKFKQTDEKMNLKMVQLENKISEIKYLNRQMSELEV